MYLNSRGLLSFPSLSLSLSKLFLLSRGSLLPSAASSIGVSRNWRDMLSRSFVLWSTRRRRNGACRRWTLSPSLSLSALRPSSSRPPRCSRLARLPLFPSISNYGFPRIARQPSILWPIRKTEGNGKTWRANSLRFGLKVEVSINLWMEPRQTFLPSSSLRYLPHFCIFTTIFLVNLDSNFFFFFFYQLLDGSLNPMHSFCIEMLIVSLFPSLDTRYFVEL